MVEIPYIDNPRENNLGDELINLQYDYLVNNNLMSWNKMWIKAYDLAGRLLTTLCRKTHFSMQSYNFREVQSEATYRVMRRYKNKSDYYIKSSFAYELRMALVQVIWGETKARKCFRIATTDYAGVPIEDALRLAKEKMEKESES